MTEAVFDAERGRWDTQLDLRGKRVAVLGSGASAVQVVPHIADQVGELKVFQRTSSWVLPKHNRAFTAAEQKRWARYPWTQKLHRLGLDWTMESALPAIMGYPRLLVIGEFLHRHALHKAIQDPELRRQLTPTYKVGCKRTLVADNGFPSFARANVHLLTTGIDRSTPSM